MKTTFRSKLLTVAALLVLATPAMATSTSISATPATPAATADAPAAVTPPVVDNAADPKHIALAQAYVESVSIDEDVRAAVEQMSQHVAPDQRVLFRSIADKSIDYNKLKAAAVVQVSNQFTDDEIKSMTKFFSSPEGKSIRKKLPVYEASMAPSMTEILKVFVLKLKENNVSVDVQGTYAQ